MSRLRKLLLELVLLGACDGGRAPDPDAPVSSYNPCAFPPLVHREPEPPSADLLDLVRACEADTAACEALCQELLYRNDLGHTRVNTCMVQHSPTEHVVEVKYCDVSAEGRRPAGLVRATGRGRDVTGVHLARAAYHEAASIHAFVRLARELRRHRAPRRLVAAMRRSAAEEVVHTRLMAGLARARGATPPRVEVAAARRRSIESIAIENAREGLVGETWSAVTALWQARHAPTPSLRAMYARIARDETMHAEVARDLHAWTCERLGPAARRRVEEVRREAVVALGRDVRRAPAAALVRELGVPDAVAARRMYRAAQTSLFA